MNLQQAFTQADQALQTNQLDRAANIYQQILTHHPQQPYALFGLGIVASQRRLYPQAEQYLQQAIKHQPQESAFYLQFGIVLGMQEKLETALQAFAKIIAMKSPHSAAAHFNIGQILQQQGKLKSACHHYQQAVQLNPESVDNYIYLGKTLHRLGKFNDALQRYQQAYPLAPQNPELNFSIGLLLLLLGDYQQGWRHYEYRWQLPQRGFMPIPTRKPRWEGQPLQGRKILVLNEQGFGDTIQFVRYLPYLTDGEIILRCQPALIPLFKTLINKPPIQWVAADSPWTIDFDVYIALASLPKVFNTKLSTIPQTIPYLAANPQKAAYWQAQFKAEKVNVGIVWAGNPHHVNDKNRSCVVTHFLPLAQLTEVQLYSLQKNQPVDNSSEIIDLSNNLQSFDDTAAVISGLDLIISVDTAVAHLAGALGKPIWTLLPYVPDWRWLLQRNDSPWYPTMQLFRQSQPKDWESVFAQVYQALADLVANKMKKI